MTDPIKTREHKSRNRTPGASSELYVVLVVAWITAVVLVPIHALLILNLFFLDTPFVGVIWFALFGIPLALIDIWLIRWFVDNFRVFRWTNRTTETKRSRDSQA